MDHELALAQETIDELRRQISLATWARRRMPSRRGVAIAWIASMVIGAALLVAANQDLRAENSRIRAENDRVSTRLLSVEHDLVQARLEPERWSYYSLLPAASGGAHSPGCTFDVVHALPDRSAYVDLGELVPGRPATEHDASSFRDRIAPVVCAAGADLVYLPSDSNFTGVRLYREGPGLTPW